MLMKNLLILLVLLLTFGCGPQAGQKTKAKISLGAIANLSETFKNGLYLYAKYKDDNRYLIKRLEKNETDLELDNGKWDMLIVGWLPTANGIEAFEGEMRCDKKLDYKLGTSPEETLKFTLTASNCDHEIIGSHKASYKAADGAPKKLRFHSCTDLKPHIASNGPLPENFDCLDGDMFGKMRSFRVALYETQLENIKGANPGVSSGSSVKGRCIDMDGSGYANSEIRLPIGKLAHPLTDPEGLRIPIEVLAYESSDCSGAPVVHKFPTGLGGGDKTLRGFTSVNDRPNGNEVNKDYITVFLDSNLCEGAWLTNSPFANGSPLPGQPRYICSGHQFNSINADISAGNSAQEYVLMNNITLSGFAVISQPFNGQFDGNRKTINGINISGADANGRLALFTNIQAGARVEDLTIQNLHFTNNAATNTYSAIFAAHVTEGAEFRNINIKNSSIQITAAPDTDEDASAVGGLIGFVSIVSGSGEAIDLRNVVLDGVIVRGVSLSADGYLLDNSSETATQPDISVGATGGLIGHINQNASREVRINDSIYVGTVSGGSRTGGLVGYQNVTPTTYDNRLSIDNSSFGMYVGNTPVRSTINYYPNNSYDVYATDEARVGGIGGSIASARVKNSMALADIKLHNDGQSIGGVFGLIKDLEANDIYTDSKINRPTLSGELSNSFVGGFAGQIGFTGCTGMDARIQNILSNTDIQIQGGQVGGIAGALHCGSDTLSNGIGTVAMGNINNHPSNPTINSNLNDFRGGLFGEMNSGTSFRMAISYVNVEGNRYLGGIAGIINSANLNEVVIRSDNITSYDPVGNIGGIAGFSTGTAQYNNILLETSLYINHSNAACGDYCGQLFGELANNTNAYAVVYNVAAINNLISPITSDQSGAGSGYFITGDQVHASLQSTGLVSYPWEIVPDTEDYYYNYLIPTFYKKALEFSDSNNDGRVDSAGNSFSPYPIASCDDFNNIGNDAYLLHRSFELVANIDFNNCSGAPFTNGSNVAPIGSQINDPENFANPSSVFRGNFYSNGYKLLNPTIVADDYVHATEKENIGIIRRLEGGSIGKYTQPLVIENLSIAIPTSTNNFENIGTIGLVNYGDIYIQVYNGNISSASTGTSSAMGGLIGSTDGARVINSAFEGSIDGSGFDNVGGLIGYALSNNHLEVRNCYANIFNFYAEENAGGLIGFGDGDGSLNIYYSYAWWNLNGLGAVSFGGTNIGGIIGSGYDMENSNFRSVYADISQDTYLTSNVTNMLGAYSGTAISTNPDQVRENFLLTASTGGVTNFMGADIVSSIDELDSHEFEEQNGRKVVYWKVRPYSDRD